MKRVGYCGQAQQYVIQNENLQAGSKKLKTLFGK